MASFGKRLEDCGQERLHTLDAIGTDTLRLLHGNVRIAELLHVLDEHRREIYRVEGRTSARAEAKPPNVAGQHRDDLLRNIDLPGYTHLDPANARLRALITDTVDAGGARLLWLPPSLPYYAPEGPFAGTTGADLTKHLVVSSSPVVPRVIASVVSYEAERASATSHEPRGGEGLAGVPGLALVYPSRVLASFADPLTCALTTRPLTLEGTLAWAARGLERLLAPIVAQSAPDGPRDEAWYWAAPLLLDARHHAERTRAWLERADPATWTDHVEMARALGRGRLPLGPPPHDLAQTLAELAMGGPATCALRALWRVTFASPCTDGLDGPVFDAATSIGWAFRDLFDLPDVTALVGTSPGRPYWRRVADYAARGNLQAVLDEYAHVLFDQNGLAGQPVAEIAGRLSVSMSAAIGLRTSGAERRKLRARFAVRSSDGDREVRHAFDSPFWPFVLATTDEGQRELEAHPYAHAVHWDVAGEAADAEPPSRRIHRDSAHAVRKTLAQIYGLNAVVASRNDIGPDPWRELFLSARAVEDRGPLAHVTP